MKVKSEFDKHLDALIKPYVDYWKLLKNYVKDFEEANKSKFSNSAWDRIKQLEKDIRQSAFAEMQYQTALECESRDKRIGELEMENKRLRDALEAIAKPYSNHYSKEYVAADRRYIAKNALNGFEATRPDIDQPTDQ